MSLEDFEKEEHEFRCEIAPTSNQDSDDILNSQHSVKKLMKFLVEKLKAKVLNIRWNNIYKYE